MSSTAPSQDPAAGAYAPYAQLVKMLLPSARSVAIYDHHAELLWCSEGFERPELRVLLEHQRASETVATRGRVENTPSGVPVFISELRAANARPLGSVVIELSSGSRSTPSMVVSMLRPVLDCLERFLDLEHASAVPQGNTGVELLLSVDEHDREDASALQTLLRHCVRELGCMTGALLVPDKHLEIAWSEDGSERSHLLDRTQKHLLAWAQLNNRPMVVNRGAGGAEAPYKILSCPLRDSHGRVAGLVALFRAGSAEDFVERDVRILEFVGRRTVAILQSEYDALTGLPNRFIFERRAQKSLDAGPAGLLYVDIDKVATINEAFGLSAGDEVIRLVGGLVQQAAGANALVSRISGDRFGVVLPQSTLTAARDVGAAILDATSQLGYLRGAEALPVSVSIGAVVGAEGARLGHLLAAAELACKRAKRAGAGGIEVMEDAETLSPPPTRQSLAAADLDEALKSNQFQLEAQPIVGLRARTAETVGYELLARMRGPTGELAAPDKFLGACAEYGLLPALDRWALYAAVETLRPHAEALAGAPVFFALNVSAQSLDNRKYAAFALDTLTGAGLAPSLFTFEIKEAAAVANFAAAEAFIRDMTAAGAKVALDDFGSGLSSLAYLTRLPVSYLKIDGLFVRRMTTDRVAESIVSAIARAARTLGVLTIAEHVESAEVAERLYDLDVMLGQGFHLGRPAPFGPVLQELLAGPPLARATTRA
ncbi:MAG TPA: GGDEF domain-containing protein [Gammaproteobacteria bacterium]|nr:GGDEF domain-containing protein [Gammaproteobacteria bacterium]